MSIAKIDPKTAIAEGKTFLGIEFGSTRIKAVLIDAEHAPIAAGAHDWENRLENGYWTYSLAAVRAGLQHAFQELVADARARCGAEITRVGAIGISAMMHGYLVFDANDKLLAPFRTWRNTTTETAAHALTEKFRFNVPQRWSIAHLYQAILNDEPHVKDIRFFTTLAGYVHWQLTGKKVLGIGDVSGMFPIDSAANNYDAEKLRQFADLVADKKFSWTLPEILPQVLVAGADAGALTAAGAQLLDPTGKLPSGIPLCPPEGDAGTGMVATNSVAEREGNVSAGTSIFSMVVLEKPLSQVHVEIDIVTTPSGKPVAMVHCNNCTSDLDAWVKIFQEFSALSGAPIDKSALYEMLYRRALDGDPDCGGLLSYNYYGGEPVTFTDEGRPLFARAPNSRFTLANFIRAMLFSTMSTLKLGMNILTEKEHVRLDQIFGHGGLFKTPGVGQRLMAAALNVPVVVLESAGEGGAWGIALLAAYRRQKSADETLESYLAQKVFVGGAGSRVEPDAADVAGFAKFIARYEKGLAIERAAIANL
ncbi:MAG: FGGY-family carbohydrate kinase [Planctomycetota bacterium]|jgi:sugar (pentulose or hexulose) kinase|nr:FGGY-family carbohydrate kinase [Planctomycetota bacterium]